MKQNFQENKVVPGKTPFFVIGTFCTLHSICLNISFWQTVLYGNVSFSILVLPTKKQCSSFLEKVFVYIRIDLGAGYMDIFSPYKREQCKIEL